MWGEVNHPAVCPGNEEDFGGLLSANLILLRNRLLDILLKLLFTSKEKATVNAQYACKHSTPKPCPPVESI